MLAAWLHALLVSVFVVASVVGRSSKFRILGWCPFSVFFLVACVASVCCLDLQVSDQIRERIDKVAASVRAGFLKVLASEAHDESQVEAVKACFNALLGGGFLLQSCCRDLVSSRKWALDFLDALQSYGKTDKDLESSTFENLTKRFISMKVFQHKAGNTAFSLHLRL